MNKRQKLGQHFLKSKKISQLIVDAASITKNETVLEVGTGQGILTDLLCSKAKNVISIEADRQIYTKMKSKMNNLENLVLIHGNGFKIKRKFDVFVSNLPYSESRNALEWLAQTRFSRGIIMVQKEFADKLVTSVLGERKAITIIANHCFDIKKIINVGKNNFDPPPKVDSVALEITKKKTISPEMVKTINKIFSYRRKTIQNILKQFEKQSDNQKRLDDLTGDEIVKIAKQIIR